MKKLYTGWRPLNEGILDVSEIVILSWEKMKYYCTLRISTTQDIRKKTQMSSLSFYKGVDFIKGKHRLVCSLCWEDDWTLMGSFLKVQILYILHYKKPVDVMPSCHND